MGRIVEIKKNWTICSLPVKEIVLMESLLLFLKNWFQHIVLHLIFIWDLKFNRTDRIPCRRPQNSPIPPSSLPSWPRLVQRQLKQKETLVLLDFTIYVFITCGSGGCSSSWCGSNSWSDVADQVLYVDAFESLSEETRPVRLNINVGSLQQSGDFFTLKWDKLKATLRKFQKKTPCDRLIRQFLHSDIVLLSLPWWQLHRQPRWGQRRRRPIQRWIMPLQC